jgi:hypothetical protein
MIRDSQPIHNVGFGVSSRDLNMPSDSTISGSSPQSGFIARALDDHPLLRMTTAIVATGVAAGMAGKLVRQGGLKLGYKLGNSARAQEQGSFANLAVNKLLKMRNLMDEFEGVSRTQFGGDEKLVYKIGDKLTTGYEANSFRRGFSYSPRDGRQWLARDQFQQALVKQARRLPYEVPAFYVADKTIGKKLFGNEEENQPNYSEKKWYNPVPMLTDFAKDIAKTTVLQMGGFMLPAALGSTAKESSINFFHNANKNIEELVGAKKYVAEAGFSLKGLLSGVGQDAMDILGKGVAVSQRSTGALSVGFNEFNRVRAEQNPVAVLYRNRHGAGPDPAARPGGSTMSKRDRVAAIAGTVFNGNNQPLNSNSLDEASLLELIPGYKAIRSAAQKGSTQYRTIKDAQTILKDTSKLDQLVGANKTYSNIDDLSRLGSAIQQVQIKSGSPLTRVNNILKENSRSIKGGRVASDKFIKEVERNEYKKLLKQQLINEHGIDDSAADAFTRSLRVEKDFTFPDIRMRDAEGNVRNTRISHFERFQIGNDPTFEGNFYDDIVRKYNEGPGVKSPLSIGGDALEQSLRATDEQFQVQVGTIGAQAKDEWNAVYNAYTATAGDTVYRTPKLLAASFSGEVTDANKNILRKKAAEVIGFNGPDSELANALRARGIDPNRAEDLKSYLIQNKKMSRGSSSGFLESIGIERASARSVFSQERQTLNRLSTKQLSVIGADGEQVSSTVISKNFLAEQGYLGSFVNREGQEAFTNQSTISTFLNTLDPGQTGNNTIAGYFNIGNGSTVNLNPLKDYGRKILDFATNEIKTPVVNFNPLRLLGAGDFAAQRNAGDLQIVQGLTNNPFIRKEASNADMIVWMRTGGIVGAKGRVATVSQEGGRTVTQTLAGSFRPVDRASQAMLSRTAEFAAGQGKVTPVHDDSSFMGRLRSKLNYARDQDNSLFRFAGRVLNRKSDVNNEAVMARLIADDVDQDFVIPGIGRKKNLRLTKDVEDDVAKYTLIDADDPTTIVANHSQLMEAFTKFANTTYSQGTSSRVNKALTAPNGPLQRVASELGFSDPTTITTAKNVKEAISNAEFRLQTYYDDALRNREGMPDDAFNALMDNYETRKTALHRMMHFGSMDDAQLASQSSMFDKSPSILTKMDEFQSELTRYMMIDEAVMSGNPAQVVANMSRKIDDLVERGVIGAGEKAEAQASVLSSVLNLSAFSTYKHTGGVTNVGGDLIQQNYSARFEMAKGILGSSDETKNLLQPFTEGTIARPRTSKFSPVVSKLAPFVKKNFAPSKYDFENIVTNMSGDSQYTFVPTFSTALKRNPKATLLSAAGIKTYGNEEGFSFGSVPISHGFERLNRYFGTVGAGLNINSYSGPLSLYGAGMVGQRVLPAMAIGTTALAADRTLGGIVNEKDERGERVYTPLVTTGAARLAVEARSMMSGITPGGMSYSEKKNQLLEGEVAIRQGRFWALGNTPFKGGKIQYFRPSWFRRLEGAATFTSDTYGSPIEKLAYYNDFSPLRPLDPYRFERKHYNDRPYPLTGEYFSGPFGPVTPLLNATLGRVLKPQKVMHKEEVDQALASSLPVGESGAYIPAQRKMYSPTNMVANPMVSYPAAPPPNIPAQPLANYPIQGGPRTVSPIFSGASRQNASYATNAVAMQSASARTRDQISSINNVLVSNSSSGSSPSTLSRIANQQGSYGVPTGTGIMPAKIVPAGTPIRAGSAEYLAGDTAYKLQETAGIYGFLGGNLRSAMTGGAYDFEPNATVLQSASKAYGTTRAFWDLNLGGMGDVPLPAEGAIGNIEISEVIRRFIPKERTNVNFINPIKNTMGRQYPFMPGSEYFTDFTRGDPFVKVPEGELRLPGVGYERFNRIYSDESGRYGAVNQYDILSDVAPYSKEFRALDKRIDSMDLSEEERAKVQEVRAQRRAIEESKTGFTEYSQQDPTLMGKILNPFETTKEALLHSDNIVNNKFTGKKTATEDWERRNVYGTTFPEWQRPIDSYIKPVFDKGTQRNPLLAAGIGAVVFGSMVTTRPAKIVAGTLGGLAVGAFSAASKVRSDRYMPKQRRQELALEEYSDILNYVKYTSAASRAEQSGDLASANQFMALSKKTMYGVDLDNQNINQIAAAIPKRKRDHFKAMLEAPQHERGRILSTAGRLERRIYEAAWGMKVESRPDLVEYFQDRELPGADWEGWHPNTNMEHVKIKMGQSMGLEMSQMGYYPQQVKEANLTNVSYPSFGTGRSQNSAGNVKSRLQQLMNDNNISGRIVPVSGSSNPGSVNISAGVR